MDYIEYWNYLKKNIYLNFIAVENIDILKQWLLL